MSPARQFGTTLESVGGSAGAPSVSSHREEIEEEERERFEQLGRDAGEAASTWMDITSDDDARALLRTTVSRLLTSRGSGQTSRRGVVYGVVYCRSRERRPDTFEITRKAA